MSGGYYWRAYADAAIDAGLGPDDAWEEPEPIGLRPLVPCDKSSINFVRRGIAHKPCDRPRGHRGLCCFEAL